MRGARPEGRATQSPTFHESIQAACSQARPSGRALARARRIGSVFPDRRPPDPDRRVLQGQSAMRVAVVTSSPPMTEGGHMVIARALVHALRAEGHHADIIVTPQNRFGRQAAAYAATWLTDVGMSDGEPIDRVISLRYPSYAVRHPYHVCWLNHTMREYYDLWPRLTSGLGRLGLAKERVRRRLTHAADRYLLTRNVREAVRAVEDGSGSPGDVA